jgi:hypothetical protein
MKLICGCGFVFYVKIQNTLNNLRFLFRLIDSLREFDNMFFVAFCDSILFLNHLWFSDRRLHLPFRVDAIATSGKNARTGKRAGNCGHSVMDRILGAFF